MPFRLRRLALLLVFVLPSLPAAAADLTLDAAGHFVIDAQVNGHPVRLRVDPAAPGYIILNPAAVRRVGLRASLTRAQTFVGPIRLRGSSKAANVTIGGTTTERRLLWWDREVVPGADGVVGVADLPYDRVTLNFAPPQSGEQALRLPLVYERSSGLTYRMQIGTQNVIVQISVAKRQSMATAAAGALVAELHGGAWAGEPREQLVSMGVPRPVRPLALARPLPVGGLDLTELLVRTQDNRGSAQLPAEAGADPDEIVVTAATGRQRPRYILSLGADWLAPCSSLSWDNRTRVMTLNCGVAAPVSS